MALTREDLQAIGALLEPINARLDKLGQGQQTIQTDIEQIKEDTAVTREAVNGLGEWVEAASDVLKIKYPVKE